MVVPCAFADLMTVLVTVAEGKARNAVIFSYVSAGVWV
jgi:hypothetical protein